MTDATVLGLVGYADRRGIFVVIGLALVCVLLALLARRSPALVPG